LTRRRLTVSEAADALGISQDAVRMRIKRGTLEAERDGRQVFVLLDTVGSGVGSQPESEALISAKDETIATLREQLQAERQAHAEARRLLLSALEKIPPAIEPPSEEPRERPQRGASEPERVGAGADTGGPHEATERPQAMSPRRGLWSRLFGG
jgi:excisionase family DNA binding protein